MLLKESDILDLNISSSFCKCKPVCVSDTNNGSASAVCVTSVSAVCVTATQTMGQPVRCVSRQSVQCVSQQHRQWVSQCRVCHVSQCSVCHSNTNNGSASAVCRSDTVGQPVRCVAATQWVSQCDVYHSDTVVSQCGDTATQWVSQCCVCQSDTRNGSAGAVCVCVSHRHRQWVNATLTTRMISALRWTAMRTISVLH